MDSKLGPGDVWSNLPHLSWRQMLWLAILCWNGMCDGFSCMFPVFAQYQPHFHCIGELEGMSRYDLYNGKYWFNLIKQFEC